MTNSMRQPVLSSLLILILVWLAIFGPELFRPTTD
jgi:hypothetical protein